MLTFRDSLRKLCPPWLQGGVAEKVLYAMGAQLDGLGDSAVAAIKIRFPGVYSAESLPMLSRERRIRRGLSESDATFAARLTRWLDDHATRGGPYALLAQLLAFYAPNNFQTRLVYRSGRAFDMDAAGDVTMLDVTWEPDEVPEKWAQWWLIYEWPEALAPVRTFGDGLAFGEGAVFGSGLTSTEVYDLRVVPKEWNTAHALGAVIVIGEGAAIFGYPPRTFGDGLVFGGGSVAKIGV